MIFYLILDHIKMKPCYQIARVCVCVCVTKCHSDILQSWALILRRKHNTTQSKFFSFFWCRPKLIIQGTDVVMK